MNATTVIVFNDIQKLFEKSKNFEKCFVVQNVHVKHLNEIIYSNHYSINIILFFWEKIHQIIMNEIIDVTSRFDKFSMKLCFIVDSFAKNARIRWWWFEKINVMLMNHLNDILNAQMIQSFVSHFQRVLINS